MRCYDLGMANKFDEAVRLALGEQKGRWPEIAVTADVSHSWLSQFYRGVLINVQLNTLRRVAEVLGVKEPTVPARIRAKRLASPRAG